MRAILATLLSVAIVASYPSLAQKPDANSAAPNTAMVIVSHLDLSSFPNSTRPIRSASAQTPADFGFTKVESFPDGWAQLSQSDDSWHLGALVLEGDKKRAILCFTDSAGQGGTYRSTQVLEVRFDGHALWTGVPTADRSDCKNVPPSQSIAVPAAGSTPAAILQHLDDFRDSLSANDRHLLDLALPRSVNGGISQCENGQGGRASCEVAAYMPALHHVGLMRRFLASPGPVPSATGLQRQIDTKGAAAVAASLSKAGWDVALDEATAGRSDWIDTISLLRSGTDAARSEAIDMAMSDALLTNPAAVLRLIGNGATQFSVAWICQDRSIEPDRAASSEHISAAMAAVRNVSDPNLKTVRDQCLAQLKRT